MRFSPLIASVLLSATYTAAVPLDTRDVRITANINSDSNSAPCPWTHSIPISQDTLVSNWLSLWGGDYSYLNRTVTPDFELWQDRLPTGKGSASRPINNSSAFLEFVKSSREPFQTYSFIDAFHFGSANVVAVRWTLNATIAKFPGSTLPTGSHVAYNGTDILLLEPCTGLAQQVLSAQDLITYFHVLGLPVGVV